MERANIVAVAATDSSLCREKWTGAARFVARREEHKEFFRRSLGSIFNCHTNLFAPARSVPFLPFPLGDQLAGEVGLERKEIVWLHCRGICQPAPEGGGEGRDIMKRVT